MTWHGRQEALPLRSIDAVRSYIRSLSYSSWRPSGLVQHNTASPTLQQWWHGGTTPEQRMKNLRSYYENDMGWSSGPHAFVDGVTWWIFVDFNVKGVHSPSWNGTRLGFEMVGDYDSEDDETGMGAKVIEMTAALMGECCMYFGWDVNGSIIKQHKEDPATTHDCPGRHVVKSEFLDDVTAYVGSGGDHGDEPVDPHTGVVANVPPNDVLNIRAQASSSSPIIGTAENGDLVTVVGEAWNGSTKWLRVQVGEEQGTAVALYGWASSKYIELDGEMPSLDVWRHDITATVFGAGSDAQDSAYPDIDWITSSSRGIALPYKWKETPRPKVIVRSTRGEVTVDIIDLGPWNYHDPRYVLEGERPRVEKQYALGIPADNGQVPKNKAAIDLTAPIARELGINGMGTVSWRFA